jgi:hypothetical protein
VLLQTILCASGRPLKRSLTAPPEARRSKTSRKSTTSDLSEDLTGNAEPPLRHFHEFLALGKVPRALTDAGADNLRWLDLAEMNTAAYFINSSTAAHPPNATFVFNDRTYYLGVSCIRAIEPHQEILIRYMPHSDKDLESDEEEDE